MILIGEKINGAIPSMAEAIAKRDSEAVRQRAIAQTEAGANFIDVCASVDDSEEMEVLEWLIGEVQAVTEVPICIDSPNPLSCIAAMKFCNKPGMINSVSMEGDKIDVVFPAIADTTWDCVALLCASGIPKSAQERLDILDDIMAKADQYGIAHSRLHIDPLVEMLCTSMNGISMVTEVMQKAKAKYPALHITGAISNISYNLPLRRVLNQTFAVLSIANGMDSAVLDPTNKDLLGSIFAAEAMMGKDMFCMNYISAYRAGRLHTPKN